MGRLRRTDKVCPVLVDILLNYIVSDFLLQLFIRIRYYSFPLVSSHFLLHHSFVLLRGINILLNILVEVGSSEDGSRIEMYLR